MAKAMRCDPMFEADQDQGQNFKADQVDDKSATVNAYPLYLKTWVLGKKGGGSATGAIRPRIYFSLFHPLIL